MPDMIGVAGHGLISGAIADRAGDRAVPVRPGNGPRSPSVGLLVVASDAWDTSGYLAAHRWAEACALPWLPVRTELGHAVIGPMVLPGEPGCVDCVEVRRRRIREDRPERAAVVKEHGELLASRPSSWLTGLAAGVVAELVVEEADRLAGGSAPRNRLAFHTIGLERLTVTRHTFLPEPGCSACGGLPADTPDGARVDLAPRPAVAPGSYRARNVAGELDRLEHTYVDGEAGLVRGLAEAVAGPLLMASAPLGARSGGSSPITGYGLTADVRGSRAAAVLEALERYGGSPGRRRTTVTAPYQEVRECAVDPRTLGLYHPDQVPVPAPRYREYSPDQPYRWVWCWSVARDQPVLVPEQCAYHGHGWTELDRHYFVYESSNGCAVGGSLEDAVLHGLLEVAERDAFLLTWYGQLPAPGIDLASAGPGPTRLLAASIQTGTGYHVRAFDVTVEQRIPVIWAMAVNPGIAGHPAVACAAGAHPDPVAALHRALAELGASLAGLTGRYREPGQAARAREFAEHPELVREMADHALLYADPGAADRLRFLTSSAPTRPLSEVGGPSGGFASGCLRDNVGEAVDRYTAHGMDVVVVNQTTPEHHAADLHCVKVLVPGTLPMTFGHANRRLSGLPRLFHVPHLLGYRDQPLREEELNPHPHPFP